MKPEELYPNLEEAKKIEVRAQEGEILDGEMTDKPDQRHNYSPIGITKRSGEESKKRRKMAAKSRKINRGRK